jgi:hypothetical protein
MKDLEFHVCKKGETKAEKILDDFDMACGYAVALATRSGEAIVIDVVTWSKLAARAWNGEEGVAIYEEDPESSVHERIVMRATTEGPVR